MRIIQEENNVLSANYWSVKLKRNNKTNEWIAPSVIFLNVKLY